MEGKLLVLELSENSILIGIGHVTIFTILSLEKIGNCLKMACSDVMFSHKKTPIMMDCNIFMPLA